MKVQKVDVDEELIREREQDIKELTGYLKEINEVMISLITEMNHLAKLQAQYIKEQGEDLSNLNIFSISQIVLVDNNMRQVKVNVEKSKKEIEQAGKYKEKNVGQE